MLLVAVAPTVQASPGDLEWTRQFGSSQTDRATGVTVAPDGSVYVVGHTLGALVGIAELGNSDAFVRKYSPSGQVLWTRQFSNEGGATRAHAVALGPDGSVHVAGDTTGALPGTSGSFGGVDAFVVKYTPSGTVLWSRQFGSNALDTAVGVSVASDGSVYAVGRTDGHIPDAHDGAPFGGTDAFVRKYSSAGAVQWTRQFGTSSFDEASAVDIDSTGKVYVVGNTQGTLPGGASQGGSDAFIRIYNSNGAPAGTVQFGTSAQDYAQAVAVEPDGTAYVAGSTTGAFPGAVSAGHHDAFVVKYSSVGSPFWTRQLGTSSDDVIRGVALGPQGSVYVAGHTGLTMEGGGGHQGGADSFVRKYGSSGGVSWTRQFGTLATEMSNAVAVGPDGGVYIAGYTGGALAGGGGSQGGDDAFVRKYGFAPTVGLVDPAQGRWHLRNSLGQTTSFFFGNPNDVPFMGDWNCDGIQTPGLYRQSDGFVYLRNSNTQGIANITFFFGNPGDMPIAGDFNGNGCDTVSIYRPSNQTFYIINQLGQDGGGLGAAQFSYMFGNPGDKPFTGDFNGNGITTVGLHRESTGFVYYRNTHTQGIADNQFFFGNPGDRFVAGDWNGNGIDSPAVFRPSNTTFYFRFTNSQGNADFQFPYGEPPFLPVSGRFGLG